MTSVVRFTYTTNDELGTHNIHFIPNAHTNPGTYYSDYIQYANICKGKGSLGIFVGTIEILQDCTIVEKETIRFVIFFPVSWRLERPQRKLDANMKERTKRVQWHSSVGNSSVKQCNIILTFLMLL